MAVAQLWALLPHSQELSGSCYRDQCRDIQFPPNQLMGSTSIITQATALESISKCTRPVHIWSLWGLNSMSSLRANPICTEIPLCRQCWFMQCHLPTEPCQKGSLYSPHHLHSFFLHSSSNSVLLWHFLLIIIFFFFSVCAFSCKASINMFWLVCCFIFFPK